MNVAYPSRYVRHAKPCSFLWVTDAYLKTPPSYLTSAPTMNSYMVCIHYRQGEICAAKNPLLNLATEQNFNGREYFNTHKRRLVEKSHCPIICAGEVHLLSWRNLIRGKTNLSEWGEVTKRISLKFRQGKLLWDKPFDALV